MTLTERRKLLAEAWPRPWKVADQCYDNEADASLAVAAVNDYAKLLDVVEAAQNHFCGRKGATPANLPHIYCSICHALAALNLEEGK